MKSIRWLFGIACCAVLAVGMALPPEAPAQGQKGPKVDVMFVLDVTGSMQFAIDGVEAGLETFLMKLRAKDIDPLVGLTVYRDENKRTPNDKAAGITSDPFTFQFESGKDFTGRGKEFRAIVDKLKAEGGGDLPENSLEAIRHAALAASGRKAALRVMVLITDAPPHPGATLQKRLANAQKTLKAHNWKQFYLITGKNDRKLYESLWSQKDDITGAWFEVVTPRAAFAKLLNSMTSRLIEDAQQVK